MESLNIYVVSAEKTQPAEEDCLIQSKAPEQASGPWVAIVLLIIVSEIKN